LKFFGPGKQAAYWDDVRVEIPIGELCAWCEEPIEAVDVGVFIDCGSAELPHHRECFVRSVAGSAAHQLRECSCYGGTREDAPGLSMRQAARQAYEAFLILRAKQPDFLNG